MSDDWNGGERRRHPRVALEGSIRGSLEDAIEAPLVNLSLSGALLEVPKALPAEARCALELPLADASRLSLKAEVIRSYVHGFARLGPGQPAARYRAAIQFVDLDDQQRSGLEALLEQGVESESAEARTS